MARHEYLDVTELEVLGGLKLPVYTVAKLPKAATSKDKVVICSNGAAGSRCLAICDGTAWKQVAIGANVAAA